MFFCEIFIKMNLDIDQLISLVEAKPVLWDKTLDIYKDRNETRKAWIEIFKEINHEFENFEDKEKNDYGKLNAITIINYYKNNFRQSQKNQKKISKVYII